MMVWAVYPNLSVSNAPRVTTRWAEAPAFSPRSWGDSHANLRWRYDHLNRNDTHPFFFLGGRTSFST